MFRRLFARLTCYCNDKGSGPAKFERDANCALEAGGAKGEGDGEKNDVAMIAKNWWRALCGNCGAG